MKKLLHIFLIGRLVTININTKSFAVDGDLLTAEVVNESIYIDEDSSVNNTKNNEQSSINNYICDNNISNVITQLLPSVVQIRSFKTSNNSSISSRNGYFNYNETMNLYSVGSGFIISEDGYILTNHHLIENSDGISVYVDDTEYSAEVVGADK